MQAITNEKLLAVTETYYAKLRANDPEMENWAHLSDEERDHWLKETRAEVLALNRGEKVDLTDPDNPKREPFENPELLAACQAEISHNFANYGKGSVYFVTEAPRPAKPEEEAPPKPALEEAVKPTGKFTEERLES